MRKLLKIILYVLAALTFIVIAAVLCLPFLIDPNDFKPEIEAAVKKQTGREFSIDGNLELSVFPWLGISTGSMSLSNAEGFSKPYFAKIQQSELNVKLIPLFSKQLEISQIVFKGLRLQLTKNEQGVTNWEDLTALSNKEQDKKTNPLAVLAIAGLLVDDAQIIFDDLQTKQHSEIKNLRLTIDRLSFNQAIPLTLSLNLQSNQPEIKQSIDFKGNLFISNALDKFQLKNISLKLNNESSLLPAGSLSVDLSADALFDKKENYLSLSAIKISSGALKINAELESRFKQSPTQTTASLNVESFNAANFLQTMEVKLPQMADNKALNDVELELKLQANSQQIKIESLNFKVDETTLTGSSLITNLAEPAIEFKLLVDRLNIDRYLPPLENKEHSKKIATPASAAAVGASLFPAEKLRKLNATGEIVIEQLKVNELQMQGITLKLDAQKGLLQTQQTIKEFYEGTYQGQFMLDANLTPPALTLNEQLQNIQLEPFLNDIKGESRITGLANIHAKLTGQGDNKDAIKASLKGQVDFAFQNGSVKGFNIQKIIDRGKAILKGEKPPENNKNEQSLFSTMTATAHINNGLVKNNDFLAQSSKVKVTGHGEANLINEQLAYQFKAIRIKQVATEDSPEVLSSQPVLINVSGTFDDPHYKLDIAAMLLEKNKDKIDKVLNGLDESLPEKVGDFLKKFF